MSLICPTWGHSTHRKEPSYPLRFPEIFISNKVRERKEWGGLTRRSTANAAVLEVWWPLARSEPCLASGYAVPVRCESFTILHSQASL